MNEFNENWREKELREERERREKYAVSLPEKYSTFEVEEEGSSEQEPCLTEKDYEFETGNNYTHEDGHLCG